MALAWWTVSKSPPVSDVFDRPQRGRDRVSTATALAMFRDELTELGFAAEDVRELVLVACEGEIRGDGLNVQNPRTT